MSQPEFNSFESKNLTRITQIINLVEDAVCEGGRALLVRRVEVVPRADVVLVQGCSSGQARTFVDIKS